MPSVRKIAERAGVSIATVSRALNNDPGISEKMRAKVLAVANDARYAATVGRRVTTTVGLAYTGDPTISHPFDAAVIGGVAKGLAEGGFNLLLLNLKSKTKAENYTQFFIRSGIRGVVLRTQAASRELCVDIARESFPHVVLAERFDDPRVNCIDCDSKPESMRAVQYLISLGHRRIAIATHSSPDRDHADRLEGYREAMAKHDLAVPREMIYRYPATLASGATIVKMAMSAAIRPTAIYFADWALAVGGIKAAHKMGVRIPDDLSIVGFDDTNMRQAVHPTLTAVCQNAEQLGTEAGLRLTELIAGRSDTQFRVTLPAFFEINESTATPSGGRLIAPGDNDVEQPPAA